MTSRYSRESREDKADVLIEQIKRLNDGFDWLKKYVEEFEIGECIQEIADNSDALNTVFQQVGKLEGGIGVVNSLIQGLRSHAKGEKR